MTPIPKDEDKNYVASDKIKNKIAIVTDADSGIGKAVAVAFAKDGGQVLHVNGGTIVKG